MISGVLQNKVNKLTSRLHWVLTKDKFECGKQGMDRYRIMLLVALSLCGRLNDIDLRKQADFVEESTPKFHDSTITQY